LLFVSLDANEHFHSRSRCCPCCCQREIEVLDDHGQKQKVIEYYHRYVFAQINGPKLNLLLDLEPIRPGEAEAEAALRLLGRIRRVYGVRFFDAVTIDAWYVQGPLVKAVKKLGWMWLVVLKQERMEVFQEALKGYPLEMAYHAGHRRWGIENKAFNELTQSYHLEHCYHHDLGPVVRQRVAARVGVDLSERCSLAVCQAKWRDKGVPGKVSLATAGSVDQITRQVVRRPENLIPAQSRRPHRPPSETAGGDGRELTKSTA
jgi:hypothetical protein